MLRCWPGWDGVIEDKKSEKGVLRCWPGWDGVIEDKKSESAKMLAWMGWCDRGQEE